MRFPFKDEDVVGYFSNHGETAVCEFKWAVQEPDYEVREWEYIKHYGCNLHWKRPTFTSKLAIAIFGEEDDKNKRFGSAYKKGS